MKKRREEWVSRKAQREEERAMLEREHQRVEFHDWEKKEDEFYYQQNKLKPDIRFRQGRDKPIDVFTKLLDGTHADFDFVVEPCMFVEGLTMKEIEELIDEI